MNLLGFLTGGLYETHNCPVRSPTNSTNSLQTTSFRMRLQDRLCLLRRDLKSVVQTYRSCLYMFVRNWDSGIFGLLYSSDRVCGLLGGRRMGSLSLICLSLMTHHTFLWFTTDWRKWREGCISIEISLHGPPVSQSPRLPATLPPSRPKVPGIGKPRRPDSCPSVH